MKRKIVSTILILVLALSTIMLLTACNSKVDGMEYKLEEDANGNSYYIAKLYTDSTTREEVAIPDEIDGIPVTEIAVSCITQCSNLKKLDIGKNVQTISSWGITNNTYLASITVDPENKYFASEEGILYSKDFTKLIAYPNAKGAEYDIKGALLTDPTTVVIKEGVQEVTDEAFYKCYAIASVTMPASLKKIGGLAFLECTNLVEVNFNEGLESMGENCFLGCNHKEFTTVSLPSTIKYLADGTFYACPLTTVNINVTEAQLKDIKFEEGWYPCSGGKVREGNLIGINFNYAYSDFKGTK